MKGDVMPVVAFVAPIVPGKAEDHRHLGEELMGTRREEYQASRRRLGIHRESAWHQETPDGLVAVVYIEADDPGAALAGMGSSEEPFDSWFRERVSDIHGIDLTQPMPAPVQVLDASF